MIEIKQLYKSYGELEVLKDINLTVNTGEIYGLVGRSGAGKSTLLRCINGLENYQSGSLKIDDTEMKDLSKTQLREFQKEIGMIFQHFSLVERRNVYKNIALPMVCWKYKKEDIDKRVQELAKLVEISDKLYDRPRMLSGGQKQRVAIARALSMNANLLLCDEATSALDPNTTQSVLNLLRELNQKLGITIVVVTHQMEVVRQICDTISILENGKISASGNVKEIFLKKPQALLGLLGKDYSYAEIPGIVFTLLLSRSEMNVIPEICNRFDAKIITTENREYKEENYTEITYSILPEKYTDVKIFLDEHKIMWNLDKEVK